MRLWTTLILIVVVHHSEAQFDIWQIYDTTNTSMHSNAIETVEIFNNSVWFVDYTGRLNKLNNGIVQSWPIVPFTIAPDMAIDAQGVVWLATTVGLIKFQNNTFITVTMPLGVSAIKSIAIDGNGDIWVGASGGQAFYQYDGTSWQIHSYPAILGVNTYSIAVDIDGSLWVGVGSKVGHFFNNTWEVFTELDGYLSGWLVQKIHVDAIGNKWIGVSNALITDNYGRLIKIDTTGSWTVFDSTNCSKFWLGVENIASKDDTIYTAPWNVGGFCSFNEQNCDTISTFNSPLPTDKIHDMDADQWGNLAIATNGGGLVLFNEKGLNFNPIAPTDSSYFFGVDIYPNPTRSNFTLSINLPEVSSLQWSIINTQGKLIDKVSYGSLPKGNTVVQFNSEHLNVGVYIIEVLTNDYINVQKLMIQR